MESHDISLVIVSCLYTMLTHVRAIQVENSHFGDRKTGLTTHFGFHDKFLFLDTIGPNQSNCTAKFAHTDVLCHLHFEKVKTELR